jgi:hypothetical protein
VYGRITKLVTDNTFYKKKWGSQGKDGQIVDVTGSLVCDSKNEECLCPVNSTSEL